MRASYFLAATVLATAPALAADQLQFGQPPAWVREIAAPSGPAGEPTPVSIALIDTQVLLEPAQTSYYTRQMVRIGTAAGLGAGNLTLAWHPDKETLTVHAVRILRGGKTIDILSSGQKFAILRRETNLEQAMLDGVLTASLQPEGIEVGDVIELAATKVRRDPMLAGTAEVIAPLPFMPMEKFALSMRWPFNFPVRISAGDGVAAPAVTESGGLRGFAMTLDKAVPLVIPDNMPIRFLSDRRIEASSIPQWADVGRLMSPAFSKASTIPASGPLRDEVLRIAAASSDPVRRAEMALALTQDRIRYVALAMGEGGLVPQDAAATWTRRFGDCKAKTALLIGLLRELGMEAVPIAVSSRFGDGLDRRLPMIGQFDHVIVRADIAGRQIFMDGTRTGDVSLARLETPAYRWGAEIVSSGGRLVPVMPTPRTIPDDEVEVVIDASAGLTLPAKVRATLAFRGDAAIGSDAVWAQLNAAQRDEWLRTMSAERFPNLKITDLSATSDRTGGAFRIVAQGAMTLDDRKGLTLTKSIEQEAVVDRLAGPFRLAPLALDYPSFTRTTHVLIVPPDLFSKESRPTFAPVAKTVAGIEHRRTVTWAGDRLTVVTDERTLVPEVPWVDAVAARPAIKALAADKVVLRPPASYRPSNRESEALARLPQAGKDAQLDAAYQLLENGRPDLSLAALNKILAKTPNDSDALANRGIALAWLQRSDEAERDFAAAEKIDPVNPVIYRGRGLLAIWRADSADSVKWFSRSIEFDDDSVFAYSARATAYLALNKLDEALADAVRLEALVKDPRPAIRMLRAEIFRRRGELDKVDAELSSITDDRDPSVQASLADHYRLLGRPAEMLRALERANGPTPKPDALLRRADMRSLDDRAGRRADLAAYLAKEPNSPGAISRMGELLVSEGKAEEAVRLYTRAMAKLSDPSILQLSRGIAFHRLGRLAEARRDIRAGLAPSIDAFFQNKRCMTLAAAGVELDLALVQCMAALKRKPAFPEYLDSRALVYLRQDKLDLALADYDAALKDVPFAGGLMGRSLVHARKGDTAKAAADRQAALRLDATIAARYESYGLR